MKAKVHVQLASPSRDDWADMESLGRCVTNDAQSVRVFAVEGRSDWLALEFTMPTEPQYKAVDKIDRELRFYGGNRLDSTIGFPKSQAEQAPAKQKSERRRAKRRAMRGDKMAGESNR